MIPAKLEVVIDEKVIREEMKRQIDSSLVNQLWYVDAQKISELTCLSIRFLEEHVFSDVRMRSIQIQKSRKRLWKADAALETIQEIFKEW